MFDIGWTELVMIAVVALIVIGPKDLPDMFRTLGRFTAKLRSMSREFTRAMETAANESGVKDVARDLKAATSPQATGLNAIKDAAAKFEKWDPLKTTSPPRPAPVVTPAAAAVPMGPATQALANAQAERKAIAAEAAQKLRAVGKEKAADAVSAVKKPKSVGTAIPKAAVGKAAPAAAKKPRKPATPKGDA